MTQYNSLNVKLSNSLRQKLTLRQKLVLMLNRKILNK